MYLVKPTVGVFDAPTVCVEINQEWAAGVINALDYLSLESTWAGDSDEKYNATQEIEKLLVAFAKGNCMFPGMIIAYGGLLVPGGWLKCDGAEYQSELYADLATVLGATGATFTVPDLQGRTIIGVGEYDLETGYDYARFEIGGVVKQGIIASQMPTHTHAINASATATAAPHTHTVQHSHAIVTSANGTPGSSGRLMQSSGAAGVNVNSIGATPTTSEVTVGVSVAVTASAATAGDDQKHNNMQPYIALNYIIRAFY